MASSLAARLSVLELAFVEQGKLLDQHARQIERQQTSLDVQFRRIADIQAELDVVHATVRFRLSGF